MICWSLHAAWKLEGLAWVCLNCEGKLLSRSNGKKRMLLSSMLPSQRQANLVASQTTTLHTIETQCPHLFLFCHWYFSCMAPLRCINVLLAWKSDNIARRAWSKSFLMNIRTSYSASWVDPSLMTEVAFDFECSYSAKHCFIVRD